MHTGWGRGRTPSGKFRLLDLQQLCRTLFSEMSDTTQGFIAFGKNYRLSIAIKIYIVL